MVGTQLLLSGSPGHPHPFWGPGLVRVARGGHSLSCLASHQCSLREHPQPPQHQAGSAGALRASGCGCPTLIHCQMCVTTPRTETGGCTGAQWPWSAWGGQVICHHRSPVCEAPAQRTRCPKASPSSPAARRESETGNSGQPLCLDQITRDWGSEGKIKPLLRNSFIPGSSRVSCFGPFICAADWGRCCCPPAHRVAGDENLVTNSSFFRGRQSRCVRVKDGASLFLWSHPWEKKRQQGADHGGAGSRRPLCLLLKQQRCLGDKVTLAGWKPCPENFPSSCGVPRGMEGHWDRAGVCV